MYKCTNVYMYICINVYMNICIYVYVNVNVYIHEMISLRPACFRWKSFSQIGPEVMTQRGKVKKHDLKLRFAYWLKLKGKNLSNIFPSDLMWMNSMVERISKNVTFTLPETTKKHLKNGETKRLVQRPFWMALSSRCFSSLLVSGTSNKIHSICLRCLEKVPRIFSQMVVWW